MLWAGLLLPFVTIIRRFVEALVLTGRMVTVVKYRIKAQRKAVSV